LPAEPLILAFDTSAAQCAAALLSGDRVLARRDEAMGRGQAERLLPMLEEMLAEAGVGWADLDGLAVCTGPGNFTGLRVGVAAARGLALALDIPAVGVTRFEALADRPGPVVVEIEDGRRRFAQRFRDGAALGPPAEAEALPHLPGALRLGPDATPAPEALARIAARRLGTAPPPAPLYLRPADAAPAGPLPALLDDA
jgi:tRNA A37 threonylcarbamoyladenosine modification protein TsaB